MSRTELKIIKETAFWTAIFKPAQTHSDETTLKRAASGAAQPFVFKAAHRLDFETQGLLLLAREDHWESYRALFSEAQQNTTEKFYLAGASNHIEPESYEGFIGSRYRSSKKVQYAFGKEGLRGYRTAQEARHIVRESDVMKNIFQGVGYEIQLITGRRHQIRAFFASLDAPLVGDTLYGDTTTSALELFSWRLNFVDPMTQEKVEIEAPVEFFNKSSAEKLDP